jgi:hypothetical protein
VSVEDIHREMAAVYKANGQAAEAVHILEELDTDRPPKDWPLKQGQLPGDVAGCPSSSQPCP